MLVGVPADAILVGTNHSGTEFMQDAESRLVSRQPELPLKLHRRHAGRLAGDEIGGPEPHTERGVAALHDSANQQAGLATACPARQDTGAGGDAERLTDDDAIRTGESCAPAGLLQIRGTCRVIGEKPLEVRQGCWKWKIIAVENVHGAAILSADCGLKRSRRFRRNERQIHPPPKAKQPQPLRAAERFVGTRRIKPARRKQRCFATLVLVKDGFALALDESDALVGDGCRLRSAPEVVLKTDGIPPRLWHRSNPVRLSALDTLRLNAVCVKRINSHSR